MASGRSGIEGEPAAGLAPGSAAGNPWELILSPDAGSSPGCIPVERALAFSDRSEGLVSSIYINIIYEF